MARAKSPAIAEPELHAEVIPSGETEQLRLKLNLTGGFGTKLLRPGQVAFVKIEVVGKGFSGFLIQDGPLLMPVVDGKVSAVVSGIPRKEGYLRVLTLRCFDAGHSQLGALELGGYYVSHEDVRALQPTLSRRELLLSQVLKQVLSLNPAMLPTLDIAALQASIEQATGYDALAREPFVTDPSLFSSALIYSLLPPAGSPLPSATEIDTNAKIPLQDVSLEIRTPNGNPLGETLTVLLSDPTSKPLKLPAGSPGSISVQFDDVTWGQWTLRVFASDGEQLGLTPVNVGPTGFVVGEDPLFLPGVPESVPEFKVNSVTALIQANPSLAADAAGNFVIAWESAFQDGSLLGIYAQRYSSTGAAVGTEFRVNSVTLNVQSSPAVALDADGDFLIAWQSQPQDGSGFGIFARRYASNGVAAGAQFQVNTTTAQNQTDPAVAMDPAGNSVLVWTSQAQDGDGDGIYAQRYTSSGAVSGSEFRVNTGTTLAQNKPAVAMAADGEFVVAWRSQAQDGDDAGIYAQRYNSSGSALGSEFQVNTYTTDTQDLPAVAADSDGNFVIAWNSELQDGYVSGIYARRYDSTGTALGSEFLVIGDPARGQYRAAVGMDTDGDFTISWEADDGNNYGVFAQRFAASGLASGEVLAVNTHTNAPQRASAIAMTGAGGFVISWQSSLQDGSLYGVYARRFDSDGNSLP
ncbi:MAG: hypothetical protein ACAI44_04920 [Candidatus Sericytochromatia bacterium]